MLWLTTSWQSDKMEKWSNWLYDLTHASLILYQPFSPWFSSHLPHTTSQIPPSQPFHAYWMFVLWWMSTSQIYWSYAKLTPWWGYCQSTMGRIGADLICLWSASIEHDNIISYNIMYIATKTSLIKPTRICDRSSNHVATCFKHTWLSKYPKHTSHPWYRERVYRFCCLTYLQSVKNLDSSVQKLKPFSQMIRVDTTDCCNCVENSFVFSACLLMIPSHCLSCFAFNAFDYVGSHTRRTFILIWYISPIPLVSDWQAIFA